MPRTFFTTSRFAGLARAGSVLAAFADRHFAWAEDTRRATIALLAGHILVWTLYCVLSHGNLADTVDMVENWNWGKEWQWGYYKHPPFFAWVTGAWFSIFPRADWAYFLLSATNGAVGLAGIHAFCGAAAPQGADVSRRRFVAVVGLALTPIYGFLAVKFNANAILLSVWPWAAWAFMRALRRPTAMNGAVLGLMLAAAMLSKYVSLVLVIGMIAVILFDPDRRRLILSPATASTFVVGLLAFSPHLAQMASAHFVTVTYADHDRANSVAQFVSYFIRFPLSQLLFQLPILGALLSALPMERWPEFRSFLDFSEPSRRRALLIGMVPFIAIAVLSLAKWARLTSQWGFPLWFASGWILVGNPRIAETGLKPARAAALTALVWTALLVTAIPTNIIGTLTGQRVHIEPRAEIAQAVTQAWREASGGRPLAVVGGTFAWMHNVGFYSPDNPSTFIDGDYGHAPWLTPEKIAAVGIAIVCDPSEAECLSNARAAFGSDLVEREISVSKLWWGTKLKPCHVHLLMRLPRGPA